VGRSPGENKSDVIDADVLAPAGEVFGLVPLRVPAPGGAAGEPDRGGRRGQARDVPDVRARAEAIRDAAGAWTRFWTGPLESNELAWAVSEHLGDLDVAAGRIDRATALATQYWERLCGDGDPERETTGRWRIVDRSPAKWPANG
jgi:hypothetical protein